MLENALALTEEYAMLPPGGAVLCAVSAGRTPYACSTGSCDGGRRWASPSPPPTSTT